MKNVSLWKPSKFEFKNNKLSASNDIKEVGVGSRLMASLIAEKYQSNLIHYAKGRLLDLGCGKVPLYEAYKNYVTENVCVDWENTRHKNNHLDFNCDLTQVLPFKDCSFDTIILSDVLEHIPNPDQLCSEISRILNSDGHLIMNVPFYYWVHESPNDYYRYTHFALKYLIENNNLTLIKNESIGGSLEVLSDIVIKHLAKLPLVGFYISNLLTMLILWLIKTSIGKRWTNSTNYLFPYGYFLVAKKSKS